MLACHRVRCPLEALTSLIADHRPQQAGSRGDLVTAKKSALLAGEHEAPLSTGVIAPDVGDKYVVDVLTGLFFPKNSKQHRVESHRIAAIGVRAHHRICGG